MDMHASLYAIKFLISLWRCTPIFRFPANEVIAREFHEISEEFSLATDLCLEKSNLSSGWKTRTRDFINEDILGPEATVYDENMLNCWLKLYGGFFEKEDSFSFDNFHIFFDETKQMFFKLIWEIAIQLRMSDDPNDNPLETLASAISIWISLAPKSTFQVDGVQLLKSVLNERREGFAKHGGAIELVISDFLRNH